MAEEHQERDIPLVWVGLDELPVTFTNRFLIQHWEDVFVISAGQLIPPPVTGTPQEQADEIDQIDYIAVNPSVRLGLTRGKVEELIVHLEAALEQHARKQREEGSWMGDDGK